MPPSRFHGQTEPVRCEACGHENLPDAKFCSECGNRLTVPERIEERKVVSVLFSDLVGFTSRSEQLDVEDVRGTLAPFHATLRRVLESFGGTVEKFIGDVVNTAARLQSAAPVDGVLVGEVTYRAASREVVFEAHEPIDAKGKTEPVPCWIAIEPRSFVPISASDQTPFVGRERERRRLIDVFEECRAERRVSLVTVVGLPGIGKSRLVEELRSYVEADADLTTWRHGHVLSYGSGVAFYALSEIVKQECGILDSDGGHVVGEKLDSAIGALELDGTDARWVRNQIGPLVGMHAAADGSGQPEAFAGWRLFFEGMGAQSPTVLVVDDLHWADDALLDFVDGLVDRVNDVPLLVVATARPELFEHRPDWAGGKINALTIGLGPLSTEHTTALIGEILDRSLLPVDAEAVLLERAGGNPLYAQEYVRAIVERGASADLPETVQGIIAARLDSLSAGEKSLLQDAAVIGTTVWLGAVCTLGDRDRTETDALLLRLERKQLVARTRRSSIAGEVEFSFTHALIREVAYSQLPRSARAQRHARAAAWLERVATDRADSAELIAQHYTTALDLHRALGTEAEAILPTALTALTAAARQAVARHDHTAAMRYAETALTLRPDPDQQAELLVLRAVAGYTAGDPDESLMLEARDAALTNGRAEDAVHLTCFLSAWAEYYAADIERSNAFAAEALRLAAELPPGPITTLAAYAHAYRLTVTGRNQEAIDLANTEIARAIDAGAEAAVGLMLIWRGVARVDMGIEEGLADIYEAVRILEAHAHPKASIAAYNLGDTLEGFGLMREEAAALETARAHAHRSGNELDEAVATMGLARLAYHRGEAVAARALLDGMTVTTEWLKGNVANVRGQLLLADDPDEAAAAANRQLAYARHVTDWCQETRALALAARAALAVGDGAAANTYIDEFLETWSRVDGRGLSPQQLAEIGLVVAAHGRHLELAAILDRLPASTPWSAAARARRWPLRRRGRHPRLDPQHPPARRRPGALTIEILDPAESPSGPPITGPPITGCRRRRGR